MLIGLGYSAGHDYGLLTPIDVVLMAHCVSFVYRDIG